MISECSNTTVQLGDHLVLKSLNWQIPKGKVIGLLGKNGAGKTTLIRTLLGLIKPYSGKVQTLGINPQDFDDEHKEKLAYVPQTAIGYEGLKVEDAIELHASCYPAWDKQLEQRMVEKFSLRLKSKVHKLSVGQRQALMLVFALCVRPKLLIMDEPVASLDPSARREVLQFVAEIAGDDCTILYSTHLTADLSRMADEVALLADGQIQFHHSFEQLDGSVLVKGATDDFFQSANLGEKVLTRNKDSAVISGWKPELKNLLPEHALVQPLSLEELFIRWHQINGTPLEIH